MRCGPGRRSGWKKRTPLALLFTVAVLGQACTSSPSSEDGAPGQGGSTSTTGEPAAGVAVATVASGDWTDPAVWSGERLPGASDTVEIRHEVLLDQDAAVAGIVIDPDGALSFEPSSARTLTSSGNVVVEGRLQMRPASDAMHTLRFSGIDESAFVGEVEGPVDSDVGLWIMGSGRLDAVGTPKSGWLRATEGLSAGASDLTLESPPVGWEVGDEIVVVPTEAGDSTGFEVRTIAAISGATVTLSSALDRDHPAVDGLTPEVANLTRDVQIEGTPSGRAHVFITSSVPQTIKYVGIRYVGPRNADGFLVGRYGLHFHRMHDAARGSLVEGVVVRDAGSHAFVTHASHGITIRDSVAYDVMKEAFWWDRPPDPEHNDTRDLLWDHCLAALVGGYGSEDQRASGFLLGSSGTDSDSPSDVIRDSVAVGVHGDGKLMSGFQWPTGQSEPWEFNAGNVSHNNDLGMFVWSNDSFRHDVLNVRLYHNTVGLFHGAYKNVFVYGGLRILGTATTAVVLWATSGSDRVSSFEDVYIEGASVGLQIGEHNLPPENPTELSNWVLSDVATPVVVDESLTDHGGTYELLNWTVDGRLLRCSDIEVDVINPETVIQVRDARGALLFSVTANGCG